MSTPQEALERFRSEGRNPLTAWYDADPAGWRPYMYDGFCDLGVAANAQNRMTIPTMFAPFIWVQVTHGVVGNFIDWQTSGLINDGQYLVQMAEQRANYLNQPTPANLAFGPHIEGSFADLPMPIFFPAEHTVNIELTNIYTRVLTPQADTFRVHFVLRGMQYHGDLKPPQELLNWSGGR
ncbi:MAG: hypothetical protein PHD68_02265 [Rugosibacter sp.]|nr:hypothetical protein [Rugosibacter sp.]